MYGVVLLEGRERGRGRRGRRGRGGVIVASESETVE